ncbi:ferrous iron transport protein B [Niallia sp. Sow4_A1]|uniref:ferrous iron transport protein B n=1 Tax=Niallia sp. Sow4_A1 TaxID=3438793 RepID=UPI003F9C03F0
MEIALLGNPNTGKTSLFNNLTSSYEYVGNWSGVTVEKKVGLLKNKRDKLIDLPGIYTLSPLSKDEAVVSQFLLEDHVDKLLNILDASQLHRNLHLTIQILEYGKPVDICLNMVDVAKQRGILIDIEKLSSLLGVKVTPVIARSGKGCEQLSATLSVSKDKYFNRNLVDYGKEIKEAIEKIQGFLHENNSLSTKWLTLQLLEGNQYVKTYLKGYMEEEVLNNLMDDIEVKIKQSYKVKSVSQYIYRKRQEFIDHLLNNSVTRTHQSNIPLTDKIDRIVTNRILGIPIFLFMMYIMFMLTFDWLGTPLSDLLDSLISGPVTIGFERLLSFFGVSVFIRDLIVDGIIAGVGGVLVFIPQMFILFFFIALLEDSGYMARVALVMDRIMDKVGLNGKAFIPMIIGFGCNVPGIMAARTIETPKERLLTTLLTPLMSCSARLPIYALFVGAFFIKNKAIVVLSLYVLGIVLSLVLARVFSKTILKGETSLFVIELPPYRLPQGQALWKSTWEKGKGFLRKASTFIFAGSVLIWLLSYTGPGGLNVEMDKSFLSVIGGVIAPILAPLGFGSWQAASSLLTGFLAKEAIISTMNIIYFVPDEATLQGLLVSQYTPLAAYSFMVFILLYIPCLATTATIYKERGSKKWTIFSIIYSLTLAYIISFLVYQGGRMFGLA